VLITGGAGSGKSTFLRNVAFLLGCGIADTRIDSVPFPILIRLPELDAEDDSPRRIGDFLDVRNRELGWRVADGYFRDRLAAGGAVLLLDDLDQAPTTARLIGNAAAEFRRCRFVVASRPGVRVPRGFEIASLPVFR
jgi:hypothetical protein